jgi:uncharacterized membrane protein
VYHSRELASRLHTAFVAATGAWVLLLLLAPFLSSRSHASVMGTGLVVAVYGVGSIICHQLPGRSFHLWAAQMPVCARCAGIYAGAAVMAAGVFGARAFSTSARETRERATVDVPKRQRGEGGALRRIALPQTARLLLAAAVGPSAVTLVFEWATGHTPGNWIRFAAGIPIGAAVAWLVRLAAEDQVN